MGGDDDAGAERTPLSHEWFEEGRLHEPPCLVISIRLLEGGWRATGRGAASYVEGNYGTAAAGLHRGNALIGTGNARLAACLRGSRVR